MEGYVIQSHRRKQDQYLFDFASGCRDHGDRNDRRDHLWMERKETGYDSDADIRHFPCISRSGFRPGSCSRDGRRRTECGYSPWGDQLAEICKDCQKSDIGTERKPLYAGGNLIWMQYQEN